MASSLNESFFLQGVLTNLRTRAAVEYGLAEPIIDSQQSIDSNIRNDDTSLVSIQDSVQSAKPLEAIEPAESAVASLAPSDGAVTKLASGLAESVKLEDLCNPSKFTIGGGAASGEGEANKRKANKITKEDFFKASNRSKDKSSDPFSSLDPLRKQC